MAGACVASALLTARRPAYGLAALFAVTPIAFAHDLIATTVTLPKAVLVGVLLSLTTYGGSLTLLRRYPAPLLLAALAAFFVATALTLGGAAARGPALRETFKVVEYAGFFVAAYLCYAFDREDALPVGAFAASAIVVAISALAQEFVGAPSGLYIGNAIVPRVAGLLEGPNQLAGYCEIALATLSAWALAGRRGIVGAALGLIACAAVLTFSRAGWAGIAVVGGILALAGGRPAWTALRPALAGLAAGFAGAGWWAIYAHAPGLLRASLEPSGYAGGVGNRGQLWSAAWRMWRDRPLLGVGAGNYELDLPAYGVYGVRTHANSLYLQSLAEGGLVLFASTLALLGTVIATLAGARPVQRLRTASPWIVAAVAATIALTLHQTVDYLFFYPKVGGAWWLLVGTAAAALTP